MGGLETHFSRYRDYYNTDERKIECAEKYLSPAVREQWDIRARGLGRATWFDFCACLANQLAPTLNGPVARRLSTKGSQRENQTVTGFAIWLQQFVPYYTDPRHNRMRHLYDRVHPSLREYAALTASEIDTFADLADFVKYLRGLENGLPERAEALARKRKK